MFVLIKYFSLSMCGGTRRSNSAVMGDQVYLLSVGKERVGSGIFNVMRIGEYSILQLCA